MKKIIPISCSFSTRMSLHIVLITAVIFILAFGVYFRYVHREIKSEATRHAQTTLSNTILRMDNMLQAVEVAVENMAWLIPRQLEHPDSMYVITRQLLANNPGIIGSAIAFEPNYYPSKGEYFSPYTFRSQDSIRSVQLGGKDYEYQYMDWYQIPKLLNCSYWSEPYFDKGGGEKIMSTYSKPLYDKDRKLYAIFTADISLEWLSETINSLKPYPHSYNLMVGRGGAYLVHHNAERILDETIFTATLEMKDTTVLDIGRRMVAGERGMATLQNDDTLSYVCYAPVPSTGWSVAIVCPYNDVFAGVQQIKNSVLIVTAVGLLFLLIFSIRIIKRLTGPLSKFADSAVSIAGGNFNTPLPPITSKDEMGKLHHSFEFMQQSLTSYMKELEMATSSKERIESELRIASEIQMGMIPKIFPPFPERDDIDLYAVLIPAKEVGGDLYDFFIEDEKLYFIIGDVSGKGVPASLLMAVTRSLFRTVSSHVQSPAAIVQSMNDSIAETNEANMFVTLFVGILNLTSGHLHYCNAGHNPPVTISAGGEVAFLQTESNISAGVLDGFPFQEQECYLSPYSSLFLYTDGLTEAENTEQELFSEKRLLKELALQKQCTARETLEGIQDAVQRHVMENEQSDDLTMLSLYYKREK